MKRGLVGDALVASCVKHFILRPCRPINDCYRQQSRLQGGVEEITESAIKIDAPSTWRVDKRNKENMKIPFVLLSARDGLEFACLSTPAWVEEKVPTLQRQAADTIPCSEPCSISVPWSRHCELGQLHEAYQALDFMSQQGTFVSRAMIYCILKRCIEKKDLVVGRLVHALAVRTGYEANAFIGNHLIRMYASQGSLSEANKVFSKLSAPDSFVWASIITAQVDYGQPSQGINLYKQMRQSGVRPDAYSLVAVLKACATAADLTYGKLVHADVRDRRLEENLFVGCTLIDMYAKCKSLEDAVKVFYGLPARDVVTWNSMLSGYVQHGFCLEALTTYRNMQQSGTKPDHFTFVTLLKACGTIGAVQDGKQIHMQITERGLGADPFVGNTLVDMYCKFGSLDEAHRVFGTLPKRDVVVWNSMIRGYAQHGLGQKTFQLYERMQQVGMVPDSNTFVTMLNFCSNVGALQKAEQLHGQIVKIGLETDVYVAGALVNMYCKLGSLESARKTFDKLASKNVVTWNSMIGGYAQRGLGLEALRLYSWMQQDPMTPANDITLVTLLKVCGRIGSLREGKQIHSQILKNGVTTDVFIETALMDMYIKCGSLDDAHKVFDRMSSKNLVTWNALLAGYAQQGLGKEVLNLYASMEEYGLMPDNFTFSSVLGGCGCIGAIQDGKRVHYQILQRGLEMDAFVGSSLLDMYARCGSMEDASKAFNKLPTRDVVTWNALINGYSQHNDCISAMHCFEKMQQEGIEPDAMTFRCLLVACSHVELVNEGEQYFKVMTEKYGIQPSIEHYTCLVDLLGRSGRLDEAADLLRGLPFEHDSVGWRSLLHACKRYGNTELARRCFERLVHMEPKHSAAYLLLTTMYADAGKFEDVAEVERLRQRAGAQKMPAKASIELNNQLYEFTVGQTRGDTSAKLKSLNLPAGREEVAKDASEERKNDGLCEHAEKLALAFGLLNTPAGTTLHVVKNLRMCRHCHNGTKVISSMEGREIIIRDAHRVHHFKDGVCSCGDDN